MITYHAKNFENGPPRAHPWTIGKNETEEYIDFKRHPSKIRITLEDWVAYDNENFAEEFFLLLEWLNGPESTLESNDCAYLPPSKNTDKQFKFKKRSSGRLMVLFRDINENTQGPSIDWLFNEMMRDLDSRDNGFKAGAIGLSFTQSVYMALSPEPQKGAKGWQVMFSLFAYGKNNFVVNENMHRVILNLRESLASLNQRILEGEVQRLYA